MKTLIITAAPHKTSFTHNIAKSYLEKNKDSEIIDLYDEKYSQKFLKFENMREMPKDSVKDLIQKKMSEVDEYVFVFPVWWGGVPAILKNFFDTNLSSGFAFKFGKNGVQKLLNDKTAKVFCTCDAPGFIYKFPFFIGVNLKKFLSRAILGFCGIKLKSFNIYSSLRSKTEEQKKKILENIG